MWAGEGDIVIEKTEQRVRRPKMVLWMKEVAGGITAAVQQIEQGTQPGILGTWLID